MDPFSVFLMVGMGICALMGIRVAYDLYRTFFMYSKLVQSLAKDPEFLQHASQTWDDEQFERLSIVVRNHIERLRFPNPAQIIWPLNQTPVANRFSYVRGLASAAEKRAQQAQ
jgi:hypothetical protein